MPFTCRLLLFALASTALACSTSNSEAGDGGGDVRITDGGAEVSAKHDSAIDGGVPFLTELSVTAPATGDASAPITLEPPFSPTIYDYYVRCAEGTNILTISMTASRGAVSLVTQPTLSPSLPKQTLLMGVGENQAVVAAATDGTASQAYWVRCLPHDFPHLQMSPHAKAGTPTPGYYLVGNESVQTGQGWYAMVLDGHGVPVWYGALTDGNPVYDVESLGEGMISFASPFQVLQLSPPSTVYVLPFGLPSDPHELRILSNGHYLAFWTPLQTGYDLTGVVLPLADGGSQAFGPDASILGCDILELDAMGTVVWSWQATDHFDPAKAIDLFMPALSIGPDAGLVVDPFHCNSIDVDKRNGNLLVSARHMDSLFYIDKASYRVLWKMGGADTSKDNATYISVADRFIGQHDARFQPGWKEGCGGGGQISLFDDQTNLTSPARGVVYDVHIGAGGGDGGAAGDCGISGDGGVSAATLSWQYGGDASTFGTGSFRILPDGSRIIGWGSNTTVAFTEVDVAKNDLLDFYFTDGDTSYRAIKVPLSTFNLSVLRLTAGLPLGVPP